MAGRDEYRGRRRRWLAAALALAMASVAPAWGARPHLPARPLAPQVVIDPGHGGRDPGTSRGPRLLEKDLTLQIARQVSVDLRRVGIGSILTRGHDRVVSLAQRVTAGNASAARLFLSIHCNSNADPTIRGFSVLVMQSNPPAARRAAQCVAARLEALGPRPHGSGIRPDDRGLGVLDRTRMPAVLVEVGFLSNRADAALLGTRAYRAKVAAGIAAGIADYLRAPQPPHE